MLGRRLAPQCRSRGARRLIAVLALIALGGLLALGPAAAQMLAFPPAPPPPKKTVRPEAEKQMLVQARELNYDYSNHRVSAVGNVQIYYGGSTLEADRVIYNETTKRLHAEGNVR